MTDTKKPKLSEIRARNETASTTIRQNPQNVGHEIGLSMSVNVFEDIPHLLDLVKRLGEVLERFTDMHVTFCDQCIIAIPRDGGPPIHQEDCPIPKARALLKELKQ